MAYCLEAQGSTDFPLYDSFTTALPSHFNTHQWVEESAGVTVMWCIHCVLIPLLCVLKPHARPNVSISPIFFFHLSSWAFSPLTSQLHAVFLIHHLSVIIVFWWSILLSYLCTWFVHPHVGPLRAQTPHPIMLSLFSTFITWACNSVDQGWLYRCTLVCTGPLSQCHESNTNEWINEKMWKKMIKKNTFKKINKLDLLL